MNTATTFEPNRIGTRRPLWHWLAGAALVLLLLVLALVAHAWWVVASFDTQTLPARHGQVDAQLYARDGVGAQPLIVGLGGSEGGNAWASERWARQRERFLAQGYAFLAVGYFGLPNTPAELDRIAIEGVQAAIRDAGSDPRVDARCVALIGGSRGAELALLLAAHDPAIDAVVAIVPGSAVFPALNPAMVTPGFSINGQSLPFVPVPWRATPDLLSGNLRGAFEQMMANTAAMAEAAIPVEQIGGPILFVSATRDELWPSKEMSEAMMQRLRDRQFRHTSEHLAIAGGHTAPLKAFPQIEDFLRRQFPAPCGSADAEP
jgi:dienelactone hydrolase